MPEAPRLPRLPERGAVAVETALVMMLLLTVLFGIVESSFLFKDAITVSSASRAGARMGSSLPREANFAQLSSAQVANAMKGLDTNRITKVWIYGADSTGEPPTACGSQCISYEGSTGVFTLVANNWAATSQNACAGDPNRSRLGVYVEYRHDAVLGMFFDERAVSGNTVMVLEPRVKDKVCK
jgi:Flp pilus assembly protein TadG